MGRTAADNPSKILAFVAAAFGFVALVLCCVGIGTNRWYTAGSSASNYVLTSANFFSTCSYDPTSGSQTTCASRSGSYHPICSSTVTTTVYSQSDCNNRLQNASGLGIVGIILLAFGIVATIIMALGIFSEWFLNLIPGILLFLASLFMLAALAEGSRYLVYNGYSANLYESGHLFTMLSLFLSSAAGGRIAYACGGGR